ncbi:DUF1822 family protein [Acaryochloris sp. IP29b_bin.137]|uniref:DUF1822 family protein n=1 Tax=Acaryochloris sp. IP29b_bin.137 TaxID=2969217 RepID=UPI00261F9186|nr:DUF1822 family protein [Acaryochloris sp. IP29b_bin.137]
MSIHSPITFTVPLSWEAQVQAQHHRAQQVTLEKAKKAYLNTLAVYAVDYYLRCLGFKPDLSRSDCTDQISLHFLDIADLLLPNLGKLECRPVLPGAEVLEIPSEVHEDRIGYLAVQFTQSLKQATILGFIPDPLHQVPLSHLKSLATFPEFLHDLRQTTVVEQLEPFQGSAVVELGQWLEGVVSTGWQTLDTLLNYHPQCVMLRSQPGLEDGQLVTLLDTADQAAHTSKVKLVDLGLQLGEQTVMLMLTLALKEDRTLSTQVRIYPARHEHLPPQLQLRMLSETGDVLQEVWSRGQDNYIQLKPFSGERGDRFRLQMALDEICVTENFVY